MPAKDIIHGRFYSPSWLGNTQQSYPNYLATHAIWTPQSVGRVPVASPPALWGPLHVSTTFGFDTGYSTALVVLTVHLVPHVADQRGIKYIPGPWLAQVHRRRVAARGHKFDVVRELHRQYRPSIFPIIPNIVSVLSDPRSLVS